MTTAIAASTFFAAVIIVSLKKTKKQNNVGFNPACDADCHISIQRA